MRRIRGATLLVCALLLTACAGPKRLPPVAGDTGGPTAMPAGIPVLLGVGLVEEQSDLELAVDGPALLLDGRQRRLLARVNPDQPIVCRRSSSGVTWSAAGAQGTASSVILQPEDPAHRCLHGERAYRGEFLVIPAPLAGGLTLVNNVSLEGYLRGVVPWEIGRPGRDALAAVEAQAVAARTYTVSHLGVRQSHGFDVFASVMDQVYRGAADEDSLCNEAVQRTAGQVLRHGGTEITAYYSACCGGVTSNVHEVWPRAAISYLVSHADGPGGGRAWCAKSKWYRWQESWTRVHLEEILAETLPQYLEYMGEHGRAAWAGTLFSQDGGHGNRSRPGGLRNLEIRRRTTSGRVAELAVVTAAGTYHLRGDRVRWALTPPGGNPAILRSAFFDLDLEEDDGQLLSVTIRGRGYGHGIGMCQTGALEMARRGHDYVAILSHYYPGAILSRLAGPPAP